MADNSGLFSAASLGQMPFGAIPGVYHDPSLFCRHFCVLGKLESQGPGIMCDGFITVRHDGRDHRERRATHCRVNSRPMIMRIT